MTTQAIPAIEPPRALLAALSGDGPLGRVGNGLCALVAVWFGGADAATTASIRADAEADTPAADLGGADTMTDDQLVAAIRSIARLERSIEALKLQCASEIARRSARDSLHEGLAGR